MTMLWQYAMQAAALVGIPSCSHWYGDAPLVVGSVQQQQ
jgi:hypothetical protein